MIRATNSKTPSLDLTKVYEQRTELFSRRKPIGLWYGIDDDWVKWCKSEMPDWVKEYDIKLDINFDDILILNTINDVRKLKTEFGVFVKLGIAINWGKVSEKYKGIEIPNIDFYKSRSYFDDDMWLSMWDVDSGCIWDLSAINNYEVLKCPSYDKDEVERIKREREEDEREMMRRWGIGNGELNEDIRRIKKLII